MFCNLLILLISLGVVQTQPSTQPSPEIDPSILRPDDPRLDGFADPGRAQLQVHLRNLKKGLPLDGEAPESGFYVYSVNHTEYWIDLDDYSGHAIRIRLGDQVQSTDWFATGIGVTMPPPGIDWYVRFTNRTDGKEVVLYEHLRMSGPGGHDHIRWQQWQRHQYEPLAVRMRAKHRLLVTHKPNGEEDDEDPRLD